MIQQLQDEITRLQQRVGTQKNDTDNNINHDDMVVKLREQLRKAASHIKQLANDKHVLIEVGNRLRAELLRNGNSVTAFGHLPAIVFIVSVVSKFHFLLDCHFCGSEMC